MSGHINRYAVALLSLGVLALGVQWVISQENKPQPAAEQQQMSPEQAAQMEAWMKLAVPGKEHEGLKPMAGTFDVELSFIPAPGAPAQVSKGTEKNEMVLGGRFLEGRFRGEMMGQPFEGIGYTGYDNLKKKYVSTWMDSMGTMILVQEGTADATGKVITFTSTMPDPVSGKEQTMRSVLTIVSNDRHTFDMYVPGPDGKEYKCMTNVYTRAK
ncbi:DUF1579 domain-containing protein [Fontivita pretiosa]|uniref:DUF1579 domain-containing protein n=1 Tax=Fontivita pretiosa TaxID=2989684 RepID=UPI003D16FB88